MKIISIIVNSFFRGFYKIICVFSKKNKDKYIFYSFPDGSDNSFYLYKYLSRVKKKSVFVWLCENPESVYERLSTYAGTNKLIVLHKKSIRGLLHFCTSNYAFTTTNFYPFFVKGSGPTVVGVWHGMPIKVIGRYKEKEGHIFENHFDYMVSTSRFFSEIMSNAFLIDKNKVLPYGLPRNDGLLLNNLSIKEDLFNFFKIKKDNKLVFWLPTYRKSYNSYGHNDSKSNSFADEWGSDFFDKLNSWALSVRTTILIKLHPADSYNEDLDGNLFNSLRFVKAKEWQSSNIDLYEALSVSDGLISDVSSVIIDYIVVNKPVAILNNAINLYSRGIIAEVKPVLDNFYCINSETDFEYFICNLDKVNLPNIENLGYYNKQAVTKKSACELIVKYLNI